MAKFNGTDLTITIGGTAVSLNNSVSMSLSTAEVGCTNKDSSGYKEMLPGTKEWTMSGSSYVDYSAAEGLVEATTAWAAGTAVTAVFTKASTATGDQTYTGSAYFTNIEKTGELDGAAEYTFTLTGSGTLTIATVA